MERELGEVQPPSLHYERFGGLSPLHRTYFTLDSYFVLSNIFYAFVNYALAKGEGEGRVIFNVQFHTECACLRKCVCSSNEKHVQFTSLLFSDQRV